MNLPVPVYLRPLEQKDNSMKVPLPHATTLFQSSELVIRNKNVPVSQLWCAAGVNMSGGRTSELCKQVKGSQSSLDHLDSDSKVMRVSCLVSCCCFSRLISLLDLFPGSG